MFGPLEGCVKFVAWLLLTNYRKIDLAKISELEGILQTMSETNKNCVGDDIVAKGLLKGVTVSRFA